MMIRKFLVIVIFMLCSFFWLQHHKLSQDQIRLASDYKDVQLWAKQNTPRSALFMIDPTIYYGWRDYSQRSSFGNLHEWLLVSWVYTSNLYNLEEGLRRLSYYNVNLPDYLGENPPIKGFVKLSNRVRDTYYSSEITWFREITSKNGIEYFVMNKNYLMSFQRLKLSEWFDIAFENNSYLVFDSARRQKPIEQNVHFEDGFTNWKGNNCINFMELPKTSPPLIILGSEGDFELCRNENTGAIRVTPTAKGSGKGTIFFGYQLRENGFYTDIKLGQRVYLEVTASCSTKGIGRCSIIIQDKVKEWERRSEYIDNAKMRSNYVVEKKIRENAEVVIFGVQWLPEDRDEYLEIERIRFFSLK